MWEQYIRDLAIFGTNAIELIPPRSDDDADSPHFPLPPMEMMVADVAHRRRVRPGRVDLVPGDGSRTTAIRRQVESALKEWARGLLEAAAHRRRVRARRRSRAHAAEAPDGAAREADGEPAQVPPDGADVDVAAGLHASRGWTSSTRILKTEPAWLTGVVFGPQVRDSLPVLRAQRPEALSDPPLSRTSPTASAASIPVPDWDVAHALTSQREQINPRPDGRSRHLPRAAAVRHRLHHLLGRLQRRREQVRLERAGLGSERRRSLQIAARIQPLLHRRPATPIVSRRACWRSSGTGAGRWRRTRRWYTTLEQFQAMERDGRPARPAELALPAGAVSRLLRCVRPQPAAAGERRSRSARSRFCAPPRRGRRRRAIADAARDPEGAAGEAVAGMASARLHAGRGTLPKHPAATERHAVSRDRRRPWRDTRQCRNATE